MSPSTERGLITGPMSRKRLEVAGVAGLTAGEMEGDWQATEVGFQMNLRRETATRAAKRLIMLPPFAPTTDPWARTTVEWNVSAPVAPSRSSPPGHRRTLGRYRIGSAARTASTALFPVPDFFRKSPPGDIVNHKIVQGFEKLLVVPEAPVRRAATAMPQIPAIQ